MHSVSIDLAYDDLDAVRSLFSAYAAGHPIDLRFQGFEEELQTLPGKYALPDGRLFLARVNGSPAGCVALRPLDAARCEMKRLFVYEEYRSLKIGRALAERLVTEAARMGYASMLLDSLRRLPAALVLYEKLGFEETGPYCVNPEPDAVFMKKKLRA